VLESQDIAVHSPSDPQVEITEDLVKQDSPTHTLSTLGKRTSGPSSHEKVHGRVEKHEVEGVPEHSGTYTKPC
jgi:glutamate decarboxylase